MRPKRQNVCQHCRARKLGVSLWSLASLESTVVLKELSSAMVKRRHVGNAPFDTSRVVGTRGSSLSCLR
jgi:hypothetical protein